MTPIWGLPWEPLLMKGKNLADPVGAGTLGTTSVPAFQNHLVFPPTLRLAGAFRRSLDPIRKNVPYGGKEEKKGQKLVFFENCQNWVGVERKVQTAKITPPNPSIQRHARFWPTPRLAREMAIFRDCFWDILGNV